MREEKGFGAWETLAGGSLEQRGEGRPTQVVNRRWPIPRERLPMPMMKLFWRREQEAAVVEALGPPRELEGSEGSWRELVVAQG